MHIRALATTLLAAAAGLTSAAPYASPFLKQASLPLAPRASDGLGSDGKTILGFWGQGAGELSDVCSSGFNVVVLSFITTLSPPTLNLAKQSGTLQTDQSSLWTKVASDITACQAKGVKIMIAYGGDKRYSDSIITSSAEATTHAKNVWDLFLGGTGSPGLRPFGSSVVLDGIDLDNESGNGQFYPDFVKALRGYMGNNNNSNSNSTYTNSTTATSNSTTSGRSFYISADPMAPENAVYASDASTSIPDSILPYLDWVNVQFYNAGAQSVGGSAFQSAVQTWGKKLAAVKPAAPKLLLGIPGGTGSANDGILTAAQVASTLSSVQSWGVEGFSGVGVWDCGSAMANAGFLDSIQAALTGVSANVTA